MNVVFREMRKADVGRVHEIECACFRTPWSKLSLMGELRNDIAVYLVAECNGIVAGYGGMWVLYDEAHVTNIAVMPEEIMVEGGIDVANVKKLTCGYQCSAILMNDGTLYMWGNKLTYANIDKFLDNHGLKDVAFLLNYIVGIK